MFIHTTTTTKPNLLHNGTLCKYAYKGVKKLDVYLFGERQYNFYLDRILVVIYRNLFTISFDKGFSRIVWVVQEKQYIILAGQFVKHGGFFVQLTIEFHE